MSRLALYGRPFVVFDAGNKDHRRWYAEFNANRTWKDCPVRFVLVDKDHGDLITQIQRQLIQFYVDREFGTDQDPHTRTKPGVVGKQQKKVSQKK